MTRQLPRTECDPVLAGVKAKPFGWPTASLDPHCGRGRNAASGSPLHESSKIRSPRFQGIARTASSAGVVSGGMSGPMGMVAWSS